MPRSPTCKWARWQRRSATRSIPRIPTRSSSPAICGSASPAAPWSTRGSRTCAAARARRRGGQRGPPALARGRARAAHAGRSGREAPRQRARRRLARRWCRCGARPGPHFMGRCRGPVGPERATMSGELAGKVAVVTGAGRNIGRAIALALADAGAAVVVNARSNHREADATVAAIESKGGKALAILADVSDEAAVQRMTATAAERLGRIDILVNNAAIRPEKAFASLTLADWRAVHSVILEGAFLTVKAALPHLRESGAGAI